ncbi:hypothetical protein GCK32_009478 [Trichostrongylus colubriformis]|uniref:Uncharacterized protein n=1 Tax=Trichostrongylus colubriformis TaxID=6319 RepID=A0AAN8FP10_TRICO
MLKMDLYKLLLVCCALLFTRGHAQDEECKNAPKEFVRLLLDAINERRKSELGFEGLNYDCYLGKKVFSGVFEETSLLKFTGKSEYEGNWEDAVRAAVDKAYPPGLMLLPNAKVVGCYVKLTTSTETGAHSLSFECAVDERAIR